MLQAKIDDAKPPATEEQARGQVADGAAHHILVIPEGYAAASNSGITRM